MSYTYKRIVQFWKLAHLHKIAAGLVLCLAITATSTAQTPNFPERMPIVERRFRTTPTSSVLRLSAIKPVAV